MVAAFFDIDGTLARTNVVWAYAQLERARRSGWSQWFWALGIGACLPYYLWLDWQGRERFVKVFFRRYAGIPGGGPTVLQGNLPPSRAASAPA